jgi:hypothetical protein
MTVMAVAWYYRHGHVNRHVTLPASTLQGTASGPLQSQSTTRTGQLRGDICKQR